MIFYNITRFISVRRRENNNPPRTNSRQQKKKHLLALPSSSDSISSFLPLETAPLTGRIQMPQISFVCVMKGSRSGRKLSPVNGQELGSPWKFLSREYQTTPRQVTFFSKQEAVAVAVPARLRSYLSLHLEMPCVLGGGFRGFRLFCRILL